MNKEKAVELINSLEVVEADGDGEVLYYALVRNDERTKKVLDELKADEWVNGNIPQGRTYVEEYQSNDKETVDISPLAFEYAQWFDGDKFLLVRPWDS